MRRFAFTCLLIMAVAAGYVIALRQSAHINVIVPYTAAVTGLVVIYAGAWHYLRWRKQADSESATAKVDVYVWPDEPVK